MIFTPAALIVLALAAHESYGAYIHQTHWLVMLLGPATVAFAVPVWEQRALIRRHWPVLLAAICAGTVTAMASVWVLSEGLGLGDVVRLSLMPRSMSTPFAMTVSADLGGVPSLTAVFTILTGILGAGLGGVLLRVLPVRSALARGAVLGMGAHGVGVARANGLGREEGSVAGLVMVLVGVINVLAAPVLARML
jgi:putative effector of murein hydrolase